MTSHKEMPENRNLVSRNTLYPDHHTLHIKIHPQDLGDEECPVVLVEITSDDVEYRSYYLNSEGKNWRGDEVYRDTLANIYHPYSGWCETLTITVLFNGDKLVSCSSDYPMRYSRAISES